MDFVKDNTITEILKLIAPGTKIREGLENILKAKTGGLIVIGDTKEVLDLVDGGFNLNVDYTPSRLYELAKMDGAIVLSADLKRILYANAQLIPSHEILIICSPLISSTSKYSFTFSKDPSFLPT